jgi:hypothetical protein
VIRTTVQYPGRNGLVLARLRWRSLSKAPLRNWLIARSRRATGPRLLERAAEVLDEDTAFTALRESRAVADRWWGLASWTAPELFGGSDEQVVTAAWALGDFALLRYPSSERSDPVLNSPDLRRYLLELLERVGAGLSGRHLDTSFRGRFAYAYSAAPVPVEEAAELADSTSVELAVETDEAARIALADLSERQVKVLLERPQGTLEGLAARLGVSRGTVDNEYRRAILKVRSAASSEASFDAVLEKVLELASGGENA